MGFELFQRQPFEKKKKRKITHFTDMNDEPGQQVVPRVWIGRYAAFSKEFLEKNNIKNIISVCSCDESIDGYNQMVMLRMNAP
jgi:hypothetical protein